MLILFHSRDLSNSEDVITEAKYGSVQFRMPGSPFAPTCGRDSAFLGKMFVLKVLEELYVIGYDLLTSADLSRAFDQATLIFKQGLISGERSRRAVLAIAPSSTDKLQLINCPEPIIQSVKDAIGAIWKPGIKSDSNDDHIYEIKMRGNPWGSESSDESIMARRLLIEIIGKLSILNWKFHAGVNLRSGCGNCLYFIHDERHAMTTSDFALLSPGHWDRLRLIGFDRPAIEAVRLTILRFYQKDPDDRYGSNIAEYKLKGYPFSCSLEEAVSSRQLICRMLEALRDRGWEVLAGIDLGQKRALEKSTLLMGRCESARLKFACVAPADLDRLYLINFPHQVCQLLKQTVAKYYMPGVASEETRDAAAIHEMVLQGPPWSQNSSFNLHARSMIMMVCKDLATYGWKPVTAADITAKFVHQENGVDYPVDVHALYFCFTGLPKGVQMPNSAPVSYSELRVSDLEDLI